MTRNASPSFQEAVGNLQQKNVYFLQEKVMYGMGSIMLSQSFVDFHAFL